MAHEGNNCARCCDDLNVEPLDTVMIQNALKLFGEEVRIILSLFLVLWFSLVILERLCKYYSSVKSSKIQRSAHSAVSVYLSLSLSLRIVLPSWENKHREQRPAVSAASLTAN